MDIKDIEQWNSISPQKTLYISVFDTVLLMDFCNWCDLYYLMDDYFFRKSTSNLIFHRIMEQLDRYGWDGKYKKLEGLGIDKAICYELKEHEKELIERYTRVRKWFYYEYQRLRSIGCEFVFINNSQLPDEYVKFLLEKKGYGDVAIIKEFSRDCNEIDLVNISKERIEKISDSLDYPTKIAAGNLIYYPKITESKGYSWLKKIVMNKICDNPFIEWKEGSVANANPYITGYYYMGLHLVGIVKWILEKITKPKTKCVYFCARDCYVIKQVYERFRKYYPDIPEARYLQASRKLLLPSLYRNKTDFYQMPDRFDQFAPRTVLMLFWPFNKLAKDCEHIHDEFEGYESELIKEVLEAGFNYYQNFSDYDTFISFIDWFWENYYSEEKHMSKLALLEKYYADIDENDFIMDLGYSGRLQREIARICKHRLNVLYVMPDDELLELMAQNGELHISTLYNQSLSVSNVFREYLLSEPAPSCVGLKMENKEIIPIFESEPEKYARSAGLLEMQEAAIDFAENLLEIMGTDIKKIPFKGWEVSMPWEGYLRQIPEADLSMYSEFYQEEYHTGEFIYDSWYYRYPGEHINLPTVNLVKE